MADRYFCQSILDSTHFSTIYGLLVVQVTNREVMCVSSMGDVSYFIPGSD